MTTPRPDPRIGTDLGPYRIERVLGRGGMGVVYLAEQARLGRKVALKIVSEEFSDDPRARARFLRESQMAAAIDHPNILPIYEAGEVDGVLFIAMRLVEGTDLAHRLQAGPLPARAATTVLAQVASALDAAHARGLVHRDVKPANVLIDPGVGFDQGDHAYLADFGLTKRGGSDSSLTAVGGFAGSLAYIAPEQVDGREVDGRADQYSLACLAFECLTGHLPFERETDIATAMAHLKDPPPSVIALRPELPAGIDAVLARAMAKAPADRYPTCGAFVAELRDALGVTSTQGQAFANVGGGDRPLPLLVGGLVVVLVVVGGALVALAGGGGAATAPSPSRAADLATVSSPAAATNEPTPTVDVYPNAAEVALLALLPEGLSSDCARGSYELVRGDAGQLNPSAGKFPSASVSCRLPGGSAANDVLIRGFEYGKSSGTGSDFNVDQAVSRIARTVRAPGGECATSIRANGRWLLNGQDAGAIVCFVDSTTGDAILYWSYPDARILVKATNQRGDSAALYDWFEQNARFIAP